MKPDETEKRLKNALIYGTSHPEAYMTKADELWKKYSGEDDYGTRVMLEGDFLAALKEYGELVKAEAVKVVDGFANWHPYGRPINPHNRLIDEIKEAITAAAIEKMELP